MSGTETRPAAAERTAAAGGEPPARFADLLAAEWIKLWSLRSTRLLLGLGALAVVAVNVNAARADYVNWPDYPDGIRQIFVPYWAMRDAFGDTAGTLLVLVFGGIGAAAVSGEYATGLIRTTFAAVPDRRAVTAAKTLVLGGVTAAVGAAVAALSFWLSQAVLAGRGVGMSITYPGACRAMAAAAVLAPVAALAGTAVATVVRHAAGSVLATVLGLLLLPRLLSPNHRVTADLLHALPVPAWERLAQVGPPLGPGEPYPATVAGSWAALAGWAVVSAVVTVWVAARRDA